MKVYIAGPYAQPDPVRNTRKAIAAAEAIVQRGHTPYIPHLTLLWDIVAPHPVGFWYDYDLTWLAVCDALLRLPGDSHGAEEEVEFAKERGIPVYFSVEELP